jgi:hypothetical protein
MDDGNERATSAWKKHKSEDAIMLTSRERVLRTLAHEPVDRAPRDLWTLPGIEKTRGDEATEMRSRFPPDIEKPDYKLPRGERCKGRPYEVGQYTDAWGSTWHVGQAGITGEVKQPPLADAAAIAKYRPPLELLDRTKFSRVDRGCAATSRFVLAWTETRPFERLQFLRGPEATYMDLADGGRPFRSLLAMIHDFCCQELQLWAETDVDGVEFMDDWGSQTSLLIAPELWREVFRPLYREYCQILHAKDKWVFFHSDGNISDIFGDLVEIGIDAVNSQIFCMDIDRLAQQFRGQVTFWGEIDRQRLLPFGTPRDVRAAVDRVRTALDFGRGGLIAQCEWGLDVSFDNIAAVFDQWQHALPCRQPAMNGGPLAESPSRNVRR